MRIFAAAGLSLLLLLLAPLAMSEPTAGSAFGAAEGSSPFGRIAAGRPAGDAATVALVGSLLRERSLPLRNDGAKGRQQQRLAGEKAPATLNVVVMMCDFSDSLMLGRHGLVPGEFPPPRQTDRHYAAHDSLFFDHQLSKVSDYFTTVSGGRLSISWTVHPRTVNLPESMAFYGNHPQLGEQPILLASEVVASLGAEIDLSAFDTVVLVHAGAGEETDILGDSPEQIFSTYLDPDDFAAAVRDSVLDQPYLPAPGFAPGTGIDRVLILPETEQQDPVGGFGGGFGSLGVYCFEFGLHLGMLSLSDFTPSGRPDSQGIGQYGLMGYGLFVGLGFIPPHPCAYNKLLMGWIDPYEAEAGLPGRQILTPAADPGLSSACARVNITGREFWLLEYRLQDPNGDRRYSFGDDKNNNGLPDFYDMDSLNGDGTPTGLFDAATDSLERVVAAEWDFAVSENAERVLGELGWGSGVYVWHIDEGVIAEVFDAPSNLFNADPNRKAVDLEEADGIQDLDSNQPSSFMLGSDDDSFRGEFVHEFLPTTRPSTATAGGAYTGLAMRDFSPVVADSFLYPLYVAPDGTTYWAFDYADTMSFVLEREDGSVTAPRLHARRSLPAGADVRGSHVLLGNLDQQGASDEIVLAGNGGRVWVLDGDLLEFLDHDGEPGTIEPFVTGTRSGQPVTWHLPPAMGDLDGDGAPEIVLTANDAVYAFNADGTAVRSAEVGAFGLYAAVAGCALPPVLLPDGGQAAAPSPGVAVRALVVEQSVDGARLVFLGGADGAETGSYEMGDFVVPAPPLVLADFVVVALADSTSGQHALLVVSSPGDPTFAAPAAVKLPLAGQPSGLPLLAGVTPESDPAAPVYFVSVVDTAGHGETVYFDGNLIAVRGSLPWPSDLVVRSPLGLGGTFVSEDILGRVGQGGTWLTGWPRRPLQGGLAGAAEAQGQPLVANLLNSDHNLDQFIFPTRDGRLFATGNQGEWEPDWPLAGPAASAGTPALGQLTGFADADLVAVGSFERIVGLASGATLQTETISTVSVWADVAGAAPVWPMHGGSIWRNGTYDAASWQAGPAVARGTGLVAGSHYCYPSPLGSGPLKVSGQVRSPARAKAAVYNLEGELVRESGWQEVAAVEPFVVEIDLPGVASGLYLCRLVVETPGAGTEQNVTQFAIVR